MVDKCANPACCATFHRFGEGRLFIKEVEGAPRNGREHSRQLYCCWLCDSCCRTMTIIIETGKEIKVAPLPVSALERAGGVVRFSPRTELTEECCNRHLTKFEPAGNPVQIALSMSCESKN